MELIIKFVKFWDLKNPAFSSTINVALIKGYLYHLGNIFSWNDFPDVSD